jgi:hypothetical protein
MVLQLPVIPKLRPALKTLGTAQHPSDMPLLLRHTPAQCRTHPCSHGSHQVAPHVTPTPRLTPTCNSARGEGVHAPKQQPGQELEVARVSNSGGSRRAFSQVT